MTSLWKCVTVQELGKACSQLWSVTTDQKSKWAQGRLADALHYCTTYIQDGNASTSWPIFVYFMLHICKEKSGSI